MRLYTFEYNGRARLGVEHDGRLIDLSMAHAARHTSWSAGELAATLPSDMLAFIRAGAGAMAAAASAVEFAAQQPAGAGLTHGFDEVRLLAPIPRPGKILCSGVNYRAHKEENPDAVMPDTPGFFSKLPTTVIGPGQPIVHPKIAQQVDYEVELAIVIGRTMRHIPEAEVMSCIAGYTILHDVSARDFQFRLPRDNNITLGKNFDTFAPTGSCLVTADELIDPANLRLRTYLNGQVMQDGWTGDWVFPLPQLLCFLSQVMTLEPGDIVTTGTPAGVGVFRKPQVFLKPGDRVVLEIEGIGQLENPVVAEE
jgi:2,4-didehydro-3-deoxy-L-rhamnonate hydrolase